MPKQLYKIVQFHGGLNSNSDARDIAENELSDATDVMVDELGKIRLMGGTSTSVDPPANAAKINPGYGLFQFSHDRTEGEASGDTSPETGDDYLAMADSEGNANIDIYSRVADAWGLGKIDLGDTTGMKSTFYSADGALRVSDGNFGANNETQWYGYIYRWFFGDGVSGYDDGTVYEEGLLVNKWYTSAAAPKALSIRYVDTAVPVAAHPMAVEFTGNDMEDEGTYAVVSGVDQTFTAMHSISIAMTVTDPAGGGLFTTAGGGAFGMDEFCSAGDTIAIKGHGTGGENDKLFVVQTATSSTIKITSSITAESGNTYQIFNLSKSLWFDADNPQWDCAVSTLYDDSKQESALHVVKTAIDPWDIYSDENEGYQKIKIHVFVWAGTTDNATQGLPYDYPRVSGFKIYMRRTGTSTWYLQSEVDITKGYRLPHANDYTMWDDGDGAHTGATTINDCAYTLGAFEEAPREIETYEYAGYTSDVAQVGFDGVGTGFKTAVIANRIAYVGNVRIKDKLGVTQIHGDAVLKSSVNKFDTFTLDRILEASVNDGDNIVKLEAYADRILIFKKNKLELLNISQEVEFLEDTFMHKGVSHPAATCKTDFGIAWVNKQGCYIYDGQKVTNLLEKQGRQIIKESDWATFTALEPMIGYIPKKRQLLIVDDNSATGTGKIFLYDMVTQSWVKGADATITSNDLTNFVTDWNNDLIYAHTDDTGTVVKWDDAADSSAAVDIKTKDIDFGQPGQVKRIYKFYVTHRGSASNIQLSYATNGDQDTYTEAGSELPVTSATTDWVTTAITPTTFSCYSVRLRLFSDGTTPADFEINDITIVFRLKGQR